MAKRAGDSTSARAAKKAIKKVTKPKAAAAKKKIPAKKKAAARAAPAGPMEAGALTKTEHKTRGVSVVSRAELEAFFTSNGCQLVAMSGGTKIYFGIFNNTKCHALYLRKSGNVWLDNRFRDWLVDKMGWAGGDDLEYNDNSRGNHTWELTNTDLLDELLGWLGKLEAAGRKDIDTASGALREEADEEAWASDNGKLLKWMLAAGWEAE